MRLVSLLNLVVLPAAFLLPALGAPVPSTADSPAERRIAAARAALARNPKHADTHADLAFALAMRARETSKTSYYDEGQKVVEQALLIDPTNFGALKAQAWILLGKHEFAKALTLATTLNTRSGDDPMVYGFLSDANTELGNYEAAEKATQWMLDLRPGGIPALTRAAHLRELFGDPEGALELLLMAYNQLGHSESENRAWILVQISHVHLSQGKLEDSERIANQALSTFPNYHYALGQLAKVRRAQKRYSESAVLEQKRFDAAPHPENQFVLAQALELAGQKEQAKHMFEEFERNATAEMNGADNANHELIFYYADHARKPQKALKVARLEFERRQDLHTRHAYAWALHTSGNHAEAKKHMDSALAVGIRNAEFYTHAASIARSLKDGPSARAYEQKAAELTSQQSAIRAAGTATVGSPKRPVRR